MTARDQLVVENARIMFRNFAGAEKQYNEKGKRNFCLVIDERFDADEMKRDGWNVKELKARDEGDEPLKYIEVTLRYDKGRPPRVVLLTSKGRTPLDEDLVDMVDYADIEEIDVTINPYHWKNARGESGIKAYLQTAYIKIHEDPLELKYGHIPEVGAAETLAIESSPGYVEADEIGVEVVD